MKALVYGTFLILAGMAFDSVAAPKPAIVPRPGEWTVDVKYEHPQQIALQLRGGEKLRRFWYTIITLTNHTGQDADFHPKCELMTDTYQIIPSVKGLPAVLFENVKRRHDTKYPFLESLEDSGNKILQGDDNTKDIAIIWPDFDARAKNINFFPSEIFYSGNLAW